MTYAPATLLALRSYLMPRTGIAPVSLGIVGDAAHARRASYHNGWDRIIAFGRTSATDYTIRMARDRALPRTNAAAAIDIGRFSVEKGGYAALRRMSVWLVAQTRANAPGTRDIREIIYSPDGRVVLRWDRARGVSSAPRPGEADSSHLWHTHVSWHRDSEKRDKVYIFRRYFEPDVTPAFYVTIPSGKPVMLYYSTGAKWREVSGLRLTVAARLPNKVAGRWMYRVIKPDKYAGKYVSPTSNTTFKAIT